MTTTIRGPQWFLLRVVAVPAVVMLVLTGYLVAASSIAAKNVGSSVTETARPVEQPWRSSYSRRFPGCVAAVLWPGRDTPRSVVVRWDSGAVERVDLGVALRRALSGSRADDARIIGACYR